MGPIAQSVEQRTFNPWVDSSNLSGPTTFSVTASAFLVNLPLIVDVPLVSRNLSTVLLHLEKVF